jgi:hypothetical protein
LKLREVRPQFLLIWWEVTDEETGETVAFEAVLCLEHRQEIASQHPGARGCGQHAESCDLCEGRRPRMSASFRPLSAPAER